MINRIEQFLQANDLTSANKTLLVGFSGGFDSCALLHSLCSLRKKYNFKLYAAHLNHNWRKDAADKDEQNCKDFCKKNEIEIYTEKLSDDVPKTETAARNERYKFFEKAAKYFDTDIVLTAHNKSDNAETLIYRIAKGTGIKGLCAIEAYQNWGNLKIYRPILEISRDEIETYCKEHKLTPNNDTSNFDTKYKRNFVRHEILPLLKQINPKAEVAINSLSELARAQEDIVEEYLTKIKSNIIEEGKYRTKEFTKCSASVQQRIIYDFITAEGLDYDRKKVTEVLDFIQENSTSKAGRTLSLGKELWLFCNSEAFYKLTQLNTDKTTTAIKINNLEQKYTIANTVFSAEVLSTMPDSFPKETENYAIVDLSNEKDLELRYRREGDIIQPFGMKSPIKLKKYLINKGIPQHKKNKIVLLCNSTEVLWASGIGISEKVRVRTSPTHLIRIEEV